MFTNLKYLFDDISSVAMMYFSTTSVVLKSFIIGICVLYPCFKLDMLLLLNIILFVRTDKACTLMPRMLTFVLFAQLLLLACFDACLCI